MDLSNEDYKEQIKIALLKPSASRSYDDLLLLKSFISKTEFITKDLAGVVNPRQMNDICRSIELESFQTGDTIFSQGDPADRVYIVLTGSVDVKVRYKIDLTQGESEIREKFIVTYTSGQFFGERALKNDEPRSATIVCKEFSQFVTIHKNIYLNVLNEAKKEVAHNLKVEQFGTKEGVIKILSKIREKRSNQELDGVASYLFRRIPFFQKFSMQQLIELCRVAETVTIWGRSVLFKQGQIGQAFYVILSGNVEVWVHEDMEAVKNAHIGSKHKSMDITDGLGSKVNQLVTGDVFGERALENDSSLRMASIITGDDSTDLLVISKEDYHNLVYVMMHSDSMHKLQLLRKTDLFSSLDVVHLRELAKFMEPKKYQIDETILQAGKRATEIIIIETGECRAVTEVMEGYEQLNEEQRKQMNYRRYLEDRSSPRVSRASTPLERQESGNIHLLKNKKDEKSPGKDPLEISKKGIRFQFPVNNTKSGDSSASTSTQNSRPSSSSNSKTPNGLPDIKKIMRLNSSQMVPIGKRKKVDLGRIAPNSVLASYIALNDSIHNEVFNPETVIASSLVTAYTIGKHDFFNHMANDSFQAISKRVRTYKAPVLNSLWENTPKVLDENQWKLEKAWENFRQEYSSSNHSQKVNIINNLKAVSRQHISANSGNGHAKMKQHEAILSHSIKLKSTEVTSEWGKSISRHASTVPIPAKTPPSNEIPNLAEEPEEEMITSNHVPFAEPPFSARKATIKSPEEKMRTLVSSDVLRSKVTNIIRKRLNETHSMDQLVEKSMDMSLPHDSLRKLRSSQDTRRPMSSPKTPKSPDHSFRNPLSPPYTARSPPDISSLHEPIIITYPFSLVHVHRERSGLNSNANLGAKRTIKSYLRLCGSYQTNLQAKQMSDYLMEQIFIMLYNSSQNRSKEHELLLEWNTFGSFDSIDLNCTDLFLIYCRSTPLEYAVLNPSKNIFNVNYPSLCKPKNQQFAAVVVNSLYNPQVDQKLISKEDEIFDINAEFNIESDDEDLQRKARRMGTQKKLGSFMGNIGPNSNPILTAMKSAVGTVFNSNNETLTNLPKPLYYQEIGIVYEILATTSTRLEGLRYSIQNFATIYNPDVNSDKQVEGSDSALLNALVNTNINSNILNQDENNVSTSLAMPTQTLASNPSYVDSRASTLIKVSTRRSSVANLIPDIGIKLAAEFNDSELNNPLVDNYHEQSLHLKSLTKGNELAMDSQVERILKLLSQEHDPAKKKSLCILPLYKWVLIHEDTIETLNFLHAFHEKAIQKVFLSEQYDYYYQAHHQDDHNPTSSPDNSFREKEIVESSDRENSVPIYDYHLINQQIQQKPVNSSLLQSMNENGLIPSQPNKADNKKEQAVIGDMIHSDQVEQIKALHILEQEVTSKEISQQIKLLESQHTREESNNTIGGLIPLVLSKSPNYQSTNNMNFDSQIMPSNQPSRSRIQSASLGAVNLEGRLQALNRNVAERTRILNNHENLCNIEHVNTLDQVNNREDSDEDNSPEFEASKKKSLRLMKDRAKNYIKEKGGEIGIMRERLEIIESLQKVPISSSVSNLPQLASFHQPTMLTSASMPVFTNKIINISNNQESSVNVGKRLAESLRVLSETLDSQLLQQPRKL